MAKQKEIAYDSPADWLKNNRKSLAAFAGEWIAFTSSGVIVHNEKWTYCCPGSTKNEIGLLFKVRSSF